MKLPFTDYDTHWKEVVTALFPFFIKIAHKGLYKAIDFSVKPEFLEQEFHKLLPDEYKKGKVVNDKFVKVKLKKGNNQWIVIHIEIETAPEGEFGKRMFVYFYRIFDKDFKNVTVFALYVGDSKPKNHNKFEYELFGTKVTFQFNSIHIKDFKKEDLIVSKNPFALVILAGQYILESKTDLGKRFGFKRKVYDLALEKNYKRETIRSILKFIQLAVTLPKKEQTKFEATFIKEKEMEGYKKKEDISFDDFMLMVKDSEAGKRFSAKLAKIEKAKEKERKEKEAERKAKEEERRAKEEAIAIAKGERAEKEAAIERAEKERRDKEEAVNQRDYAIKYLLNQNKMSVSEIAVIMQVDKEYIIFIKEKNGGTS